MFHVDDVVRADIAQLEPYVPVVPPDVMAQRLGLAVHEVIKLDANENPYGPLPVVGEVLRSLAGFAVYPDAEHTQLRETLSTYTGQPVERIICGAGADELIDLLLRLLLQPGDTVINCPPTFGMYAFDTRVCGGQLIEIERQADFSLDLAAIEQAVAETQAKVLFLASPNNPDGSRLSQQELLRLLKLPLLIVVDEAYIEFTNNPRGFADLIGHHPNLVILRTFSKWAGLAGLRVGYGLMAEELAVHLWKIKQPYNVSVAAQRAAIVSLQHVEELRDNVARILLERERMLIALARLSYLEVFPSQANFILFRVVQRSVLEVKQALEQAGILLRYYDKPGLRDCLRLTIGKPDHMNAVVAVLEGLEEHNDGFERVS
jgi:histidinol-phosphate aminotransferase